jgi:hypothetical protein
LRYEAALRRAGDRERLRERYREKYVRHTGVTIDRVRLRTQPACPTCERPTVVVETRNRLLPLVVGGHCVVASRGALHLLLDSLIASPHLHSAAEPRSPCVLLGEVTRRVPTPQRRHCWRPEARPRPPSPDERRRARRSRREAWKRESLARERERKRGERLDESGRQRRTAETHAEQRNRDRVPSPSRTMREYFCWGRRKKRDGPPYYRCSIRQLGLAGEDELSV